MVNYNRTDKNEVKTKKNQIYDKPLAFFSEIYQKQELQKYHSWKSEQNAYEI